MDAELSTESALVPVMNRDALERREAGIARVRDLLGRAQETIANAPAPNTLAAYASDWKGFSVWCTELGLCALPAEPATVCAYLVEMSDTCKATTIRRKAASISVRHRQAGYPSPTQHQDVREWLKGMAKEKAKAGVVSKPKAAISTPQLRKLLAGIDRTTLAGKRDAALLLVGFAGEFRRSEITGLDVEDLSFDIEGITLRLRRSKTDQEGAGREVSIPRTRSEETCPVRTLQAWLTAAGIEAGPLFRAVDRHGKVGVERLHGRAVARIVQRHAPAAGLDPRFLGAHSLRSGFATSAAKNGASHGEIMKQTGHKSTAMVEKYIQQGRRFEDNAANKLGL